MPGRWINFSNSLFVEVGTMIKLWKLAAIVAILISGQALGQGDVALTVELGGDNGTPTYNPPINNVAFTPGDDANGQTFVSPAIITWDVVAEVSDSGDTVKVNGLANLVFDLIVTETAGGTKVNAAFFSTVNDGSSTPDLRRSQQNAAFCSVFNVAGNGGEGGRVFDGCLDGGPYMDRVEYPVTSVFSGTILTGDLAGNYRPAAVDVEAGELLGMGCGYSKYEPAGQLWLYDQLGYYDCEDELAPGGNNTAGVGREWIASGWGDPSMPVFDFWPGLHGTHAVNGPHAPTALSPIAEGQIDMSGLPSGEYRIDVIAGNCNVLMNDQDPEDCTSDCLTGDFAVAADSVADDYITFYWDAGAPEEDFGDAPDPTYLTLLASNGPRHVIAGPWLGDATDGPDAEPDGQPTVPADGDDLDGNDDEDGVSIAPLLVGVNVVGAIQFEVNGPAGPYQVDGWIDFNQNGTFDHPAEQVVNGPYAVGIHNVDCMAPAGTPAGNTYARFRINSVAPLTPFGPAEDGEVEDLYPVEIALPSCDPPILEKVDSVCIHGAHGPFAIEMTTNPADNTIIEHRCNDTGTQLGPEQIVATFDQNVQAIDGTPDATEVQVSNGTVGVVTIVDNVLTAQYTGEAMPSVGKPPFYCLTVTIHGIASVSQPGVCVATDPESVMDDEVRYIHVHHGNMCQTGGTRPPDTIVSIFDLGYVKARLFGDFSQDEHYYADVRTDGIISIFDLGKVKSNLFGTFPPCP
jgi:hypothetical protein